MSGARSSCALFLEGRLYFDRPDGTRAKGNSGGPSVLLAYGEENARLLQVSSLKSGVLHGDPKATVENSHSERVL